MLTAEREGGKESRGERGRMRGREARGQRSVISYFTNDKLKTRTLIEISFSDSYVSALGVIDIMVTLFISSALEFS